jgi:hypothetical protein
MAILNVRVMDWFSWEIIANQPDTLQKMTNSLLVNVDIPMKIPKD